MLSRKRQPAVEAALFMYVCDEQQGDLCQEITEYVFTFENSKVLNEVREG
jgi:hypothetical protein